MNVLLILFLMMGMDDLAEERQRSGPLIPGLTEWSGALDQVDGVWQCSVVVTVSRLIDDVTASGNTVSSEEADRFQDFLRPIARKVGKAGGLIDPKLGTLDPELTVNVDLYRVDEESEDLWSVAVRAALVVPARLDRSGVSVRAPVWEMALRGTVPQADLETVLAAAVEREVKVATLAVQKARSARPRRSKTR
jgi:hypothetical protein